MNAILTTIFAAVAFLWSSSACAASDVYAITDVTVVPMDRERLLPGQTVIVRDGRIAAMGEAALVSIPEGAVRIEGRRRYLMPGLAEMHAHVPPDPRETQWTEDVLFLYAANGITFARSMLGAPTHLGLRARAERGEIVSPRIYTSGPSLNGNSVKSPEDARRMVAEQKAAGYDTLKIHPGIGRAAYDAIAEEARAHKITFGGHVPEDVGLERALEVGQATIDHLDGYIPLLLKDGAVSTGESGFFGYELTDQVDETKLPGVARRTREAGVWNVPTDSLVHHVLLPAPSASEMESREEMRYVPRPMLAQWVKARADIQAQPEWDAERARRFAIVRGKLIKALNDEGSGLLLGSDAPQLFNVPGFSIHRELSYLVDAGLTPFEALATGTRNVALFLGAPSDFGTVEVGRRADLILLDANPLAHVANVQRRAGVMLSGRWLPEAQIQNGLADIARRYAQ